ncbi:MAG TPA: hypothetical protein VIO64_07165 [Pseudobacteroides sp.]|uniref:hypothetical protein n=1 Tax=Pseudobacteroides sp. TaxID=1968840 RepID=UPI002F93C9EB
MHANFEHFFQSNFEATEINEKKLYISVLYTDLNFLIHKSYLFSFIYLFRIMVISIDKAFASKYEKDRITDIDIESVENIWLPKVDKIVKEQPALTDILKDFGLWKLYLNLYSRHCIKLEHLA